jgi:DNA-binding GntR family transcriptional regulator
MPDHPGTPHVDPTKHKQLTATLRDQITTGKLTPGQPVPSITRLAAARGWSRQTCARALQSLESERLLIRYPGLGYYVAPEPVKKDMPDSASAP